MTEDPRTVRVEHPADRVALVVLDRPDSLNALSVPMEEELATAFSQLAADEEVSVIVVTGAGRGFCSGADLADAMTEFERYSSAEIMQRAGAAVVPLATAPQLTIAAVNGPAAGGGWGLAMACDLRIAGPTARFTATFVQMGLGPDMGLSQSLPRAVGRDRALELLLTGRTVEADEAARIGIVTSLADDPLAAAIELARAVSRVPGHTIRSVKSTLAASAEADIAEVIEVIEAKAQADLKDHPEFLARATAWFSRHER